MSDNSKIQWTEATWNPIRGCSKVSEGCDRCYAMFQSVRVSGPGDRNEGFVKRNPVNWTGIMAIVPEALDKPLHWKRPRMIFVNSMSDLFHEKVSDEWIDKVMAIVGLCPQHTFQVLTKRAERMAQYSNGNPAKRILYAGRELMKGHGPRLMNNAAVTYWPWENLWLGISAENQKRFDERAPFLLLTKAAVKFVSFEPLLGSIDPTGVTCMGARSIDWGIIGGESGAGARPCNVRWVRNLIGELRSAGVAPFVKQLGARPFSTDFSDMSPGQLATGDMILKDKKGGDPAEWPEDLRVREWPKVAVAI